jgi:hypothetical protein
MVFRWSKSRRRVTRQAMTCRALYPYGLPIFRNPNNVTHSATFWAFCAIANINYVFVSPFLLLSTKLFFPVFFFSVQLVRTDDLYRLQFFTKPALNEHNLFYLLVICFEKLSYSLGLAQRIKVTLHKRMCFQVNKQ